MLQARKVGIVLETGSGVGVSGHDAAVANGGAQTDSSQWAGAVDVGPFLSTYTGETTLPFQLAITVASAGPVAVYCYPGLESNGNTLDASDASIIATQTTGNN